ncbi:Rne/Rng family ribonuclease [Swingsia samuiensis]|uniref:Ribonuclease G n=1 Tax=Swingsia samuiensis TaxID=1293412 RepID=A0A4Y6UK57_9PROT|nr:ribonuclease E/G [Swingsia samuiensis]QDH17454.1 ribonuclease E/G [Swingsia samuiensis]
MNKRMLIDTTHAEETRVVVMDGDRVEDYDVETSTRKQLKGNIYLAKVIRVEPSLQAAFVEYGGNRHGFLAFSEIHPDYFQIPIADREKLLALQQEEEELAVERRNERAAAEEDEASPTLEADDENQDDHQPPETVGGEHDTGEDNFTSRRTARFLRNYKIQEVIRRRQVLLVQVVKEERGNKGAALTTYISLAGRYCVLMPNALRGGGVSRKITSDADRRRLRDLIAELELPKTMAMIVRTAGAGHPSPEIIRDCEYLLQLWDDIRSHALSSVAPALVYEEANLIKRAIRDLFSKDIDDIYVDGENAWKSAREFMRLLMPHNTGKVKLWQNRGQSLFARYNVEGHLDAMFSPTARLSSGGYLVINQTEALVSIDVNSGKSTSQRNIEETALRTNLEAADEVARQLRLRDLAGLIVIDFIDMESRRHNSQVEKRLKEALKCDRARIQIGRISHFGLLEMSRQRLRPSITEALLSACPHCQGTGFIRGTESSALHVLRAIDEEGNRQRASEIEVHISSNIALYILNYKRSWLSDIEQRHRMHVIFKTDSDLPASEMKIERLKPQNSAPQIEAPAPHHVRNIEIIENVAPPAPLPTATDETTSHPADISSQHEDHRQMDDDNYDNNRRRRRRRRPNNRRDYDNQQDEHFEQKLINNERSAPQQEAISDVRHNEETGLVPGRRRTRFKRSQPDNQAHASTDHREPTENRQAPQPARYNNNNTNRRDRNDRFSRDRDNYRSEQRNYNGPTPADPFGGSFDIFEVIEQAETEQAKTPVSSQHFNASSEAPHHDTNSDDVNYGSSYFDSEQEQPFLERAEPAPKRPSRRRNSRQKSHHDDGATHVSSSYGDTTAEHQGAETTPAKTKRPRRPAKSSRTKASDTLPVDDNNNLQPVNIDEQAPTKRRVGWWKR